jgi:hypothetical protein
MFAIACGRGQVEAGSPRGERLAKYSSADHFEHDFGSAAAFERP